MANFLMWAGVITLVVLLVFFQLDYWRRYVEDHTDEEAARKVWLPLLGLTITVLACVAFYFGQGRLAEFKNLNVNAPAEAKPTFIEASKQREDALKPLTDEQLKTQQSRDKRTKAAAGLKWEPPNDSAAEKSMKDFHDKMMKEHRSSNRPAGR